jgi:small subunit ribosomal protein S6
LKLYEAMFVMDVQTSPDAGTMEAEIRRILGRAETEILICRKWEDRRLAYEIGGCKRGSYWLTYFNAPTDKIAGIERDAQLSEKVLRVLVLRVEQVPQSEYAPRQPESPPQPAEAPPVVEPAAAAAPEPAAGAAPEPVAGAAPEPVAEPAASGEGAV